MPLTLYQINKNVWDFIYFLCISCVLQSCFAETKMGTSQDFSLSSFTISDLNISETQNGPAVDETENDLVYVRWQTPSNFRGEILHYEILWYAQSGCQGTPTRLQNIQNEYSEIDDALIDFGNTYSYKVVAILKKDNSRVQSNCSEDVLVKSPPVAPLVCPGCTASLTANRTLINVVFDNTVPSAPPLGGNTSAGAGITPVQGGSVPALGGSVPAIGGGAPAAAGTTPAVDELSFLDILNPFNINITVTHNFPLTHPTTCQLVAPYNTPICDKDGFDITKNDISTDGNLTANFMVGSTAVSTNSLPIKTLNIKQLSNTSNNQSTDDGVFSMIGNNNVSYFSSKNVNGVYKKYKHSVNGLEQISNTRGDQFEDDSFGTELLFGDDLYFSSMNPANLQRLYKHDSINNSTTLGIVMGELVLWENFYSFKMFNNELYFLATLPGNAQKVFKTNGTTVTQVTNTRNSQIIADSQSFFNNHFQELNGYLYFEARNSNGFTKFYRTDGTTVEQVSNIRNNQSAGEASNYGIKSINNQYVLAYGLIANFVYKLFKIEGVTVTQVSNTTNNLAETDVALAVDYMQPVEFNGNAYMILRNNNLVNKFYKYDGSNLTQVGNTTGNQTIDDHPPFDYGTNAHKTVSGNYLYYGAKNQNGATKLYKIDSNDNIEQVSNFSGDQNIDDNIANIIDYNGNLYIIAQNSSGKYKFYMTDGAEFYQLLDINLNEADTIWGGILGVARNRLYISVALDGDVGSILKVFTICDSTLNCDD